MGPDSELLEIQLFRFFLCFQVVLTAWRHFGGCAGCFGTASIKLTAGCKHNTSGTCLTSVFKCLWIPKLLAWTAQRHLSSPNHLISLLVLSPNQKSAPLPPCSVVQREAQVCTSKEQHCCVWLKYYMCAVRKAANTSFKVSSFSVRFGLVGILKHRKTYIYITELIPPASFGLLSLTDVRFLRTT